ncbi:MAG: alpha/beta hydrolase family esterase [Thermoguttaceae bacterium]
MLTLVGGLLVLLAGAAAPLAAGDHERSVNIGDTSRPYLVHVPSSYDPKKPTPVVLCLHGAWTNAAVQIAFCGLNDKADQAGFIVVYPNGRGVGKLLFWNSGMAPTRPGRPPTDDVAYIAAVLDDLEGVVHVDKRRVYATGISNGGMMCYRLAAELSDRIAAIAPISGTMSMDTARPTRPVPVLHFHGTADTFVPYNGPNNRMEKLLKFKSVEETIALWAKLDGCPAKPTIEKLPDTAHDGTTVTKKTYGPGRQGAEVVLLVIEGGGHTWPGRMTIESLLGKSTKQISANDLIWDFFQKHPMK